ncbi:MAG: MgtC/SapB transporter [Parcubacteria group bacterium GW2011_GWA2_43_17]|nr:MAG: MgtC/SapB transporter [Parcubacteria group bacterium GW2011_GWA2_43_17]KKT92472.1 MAG: MgtC/SapB transporter [Parcubacteria group bacterium GW2011_GWF2_45_11]OGY93884.1 MAG: hypothetical protein A2260_01230 [Candidatus Komeilibacteria bacterium RIFOXYA2_FULL_45_9]OGY95624.1 MAG: hypothetical protein A3J95_04350 [Candidatus Komeilibacteria bacterium RIFOXYC2_FULL_45_12]HAH04816.1 magnesium transporter MgtC [Candidatus Komeilibacteria bacterium]
MNETDLILRIVIAAIFGGVIGWERQKDGKPAGLRTHMLVSTGAALFTIISFAVVSVFEDSVIDPTRIAAGIITGVGFLGAGAILQSKGEVHGLTTAASIWIVSAVGMAVGFGLHILAGATTVVTVIVLYLLEKLEQKIK